MSAVDTKRLLNAEENMGYDGPFTTYTWKCWQEMLAHICLGSMCFQRVIEPRLSQLSLAIPAMLQEVGIAIQKEVGQWI